MNDCGGELLSVYFVLEREQHSINLHINLVQHQDAH